MFIRWYHYSWLQSKENGRIPTARDFDKTPGYPYSSTYLNRFGSWNRVLELALSIKRKEFEYKRDKKYTNEELLEYLRQFYRENERPPTKEDLK